MNFCKAAVATSLFTAALMGITSEAAAGSLTAKLQITTTWQGNPGYCAIAVVTNSGATAASYSSVTFNVGTASVYTEWYNVTRQGTTGTITLKNNAPILVQPGTSNSNDGFCASGPVPTSLAVTVGEGAFVNCGGTACDVSGSNVCCRNPMSDTYSCTAASSCSVDSGQIRLACDGNEDCASGTVCCAVSYYTNNYTACKAPSECVVYVGTRGYTHFGYPLCSSPSDCASGTACTASPSYSANISVCK